MGRILPRSRTGCSAKTQRKLSKAIRRARAIGFMPIWSRHPLVHQTMTLEIEKETHEQLLLRGERSAQFQAQLGNF